MGKKEKILNQLAEAACDVVKGEEPERGFKKCAWAFIHVVASMLVPVVGGPLLKISYEICKKNAEEHP